MSASASVRSMVSPAASSAATSEECARSMVRARPRPAGSWESAGCRRRVGVGLGSAHDPQQTVAVDLVLQPANQSFRRRDQHVRLLRPHLSQVEDRGGALDERGHVGRDDGVLLKNRRQRGAWRRPSPTRRSCPSTSSMSGATGRGLSAVGCASGRGPQADSTPANPSSSGMRFSTYNHRQDSQRA